jgi:hypothetical protein
MPAKYENLSISELKSKLIRAAEETRESMAELLYWLRKKLKAPGKRNDLRRKKVGFGAWCETSLGISRRTADRWADDWAIANGKKKKPVPKPTPTSRQDDQRFEESETSPPKITFNLPLLFTEAEQEKFIEAWEALTDEVATQLVFDTVLEKARALEGPRPADPFQLPPKMPASRAISPSGRELTILEDLDAKQPAGGV